MIAMIGGNPAASGSKVTQYKATRCGHSAETWKPDGKVIAIAPSCQPSCTWPWSTHHQHGNAGVIQDLLRLASEHQPRETMPSMRCHHDQVTTVPPRRRDDRFVRLLASLRDRVALDACEFGLAPQGREQLVRVSLRKHLQLRGWWLKQFLNDTGVIEFRHCMEARHPGIDFPCECDALFDGAVRAWVVIDRDENVLEHVYVSL